MAKKYISRDEALLRMQRYCAYQDRCHQEARRKLLDLGIYGDDLEEIMAQLVEEKFLDEERFARAFARGKFQIKSWGRIKILQELKARQISAYCQRKALEEIDEEAYRQRLDQFLKSKLTEGAGGLSDFEQQQKAAQFALRRGFEPELVWETLRQIFGKD
ncbi:MAG: RecX family transcriptional regulator [Haliscomenobacter sp.]|nr:RecX family transcriptional regulator [Haliscomenobacter sp.]